MKTFKSNPEKVKDYLKTQKKPYRLTHKDIMRITNTNCPYDVLRSLKRSYNITFEDKTIPEMYQDEKGKRVWVIKKWREYTLTEKY